MSIFQRRHYKVLASTLKELYHYRDWEPDCWADTVDTLIEMLCDDNDKFDSTRFLEYMEMTKDEQTGFIRPLIWNGADFV